MVFRVRWIRYFLAGLVAVALVMPGAMFHGGGPAWAASTDPVRFMPSGAALYGTLSLSPTGDQAQALNDIGAVFARQPGFKKAMAAIEKTSQASVSPSMGLNSSTILSHLDKLGSSAALGVYIDAGLSQGTGITSTAFDVLAVITTRGGMSSPGDFFGQMASLFQSTQLSGLYNGHIIFSIKNTSSSSSPPLLASMVDNQLVLAMGDLSGSGHAASSHAAATAAEHLLHVALDVHDGNHAGLAANMLYATLVAGLPAKRLGYVYIDTLKLMQASGALGGASTSQLLKATPLLAPVVVSLTAAPGGMVVTALEAVPSGAALGPTLQTDYASQAPASSAFVMAISGLGSALIPAVKALGAQTDSGFKAAFGMDLTHDLLPLMNGDVTLSIGSRDGVPWSLNNPMQSLRVRLSMVMTSPALKAQLLLLTSKLQKAGQVKWTNQGGVSVDATTGLAFTFSGSRVLVGLHLTDPLGAPLTSLPEYQIATQHVAIGTPQVLTFLNIDRLRGLLEHSLSASQMAQYRLEAMPILVPLHSLTINSTILPNHLQAVQIFLSIHS